MLGALALPQRESRNCGLYVVYTVNGRDTLSVETKKEQKNNNNKN